MPQKKKNNDDKKSLGTLGGHTFRSRTFDAVKGKGTKEPAAVTAAKVAGESAAKITARSKIWIAVIKYIALVMIAILGGKLCFWPSDSSTETTIETAEPANRSYVDFVRDLNAKRSKDPLAVSALVEEYRKKRVKWDCTILEGNPTEKYYRIGVDDKTEPKYQAVARFRPDRFHHVENGERTTIEGVFASADNLGIMLMDCRFTSDSREP